MSKTKDVIQDVMGVLQVGRPADVPGKLQALVNAHNLAPLVLTVAVDRGSGRFNLTHNTGSEGQPVQDLKALIEATQQVEAILKQNLLALEREAMRRELAGSNGLVEEVKEGVGN